MNYGALANIVSCTTALLALPLVNGCTVLREVPQVTISVPGVTEPSDELLCVGGAWQGIEPGSTTEDELVQWLEISPLVDQPSLSDMIDFSSHAMGLHTYSWALRADHQWLSICVISNTVSNIRFPILYSLRLGDVVS